MKKSRMHYQHQALFVCENTKHSLNMLLLATGCYA